jgi:Golgi nucleoside diphosphatase
MLMDEQQQKQKQQRRTRSIIHFIQGIAVTLFLFAVLIAIYLTVIYRARVVPFVNYAIVFDAGSSHTEMFIYHWPADKSDGLGTTSSVNEFLVCPLHGVPISDPYRPGQYAKLKAISDFEQNLDLLIDYFRPCLAKAVSKIPANRHKFSPIFLGATAGMRLAKLRNSTRANQVLETIREIFSNYPFQFVAARQVSSYQLTII